MSQTDDPNKAMRFARAIASDILVYQEAKIIEGIKNDTFFEAIATEIEEGRELYRSRVTAALDAQTNFYDRALVDVILRSMAHISSTIW